MSLRDEVDTWEPSTIAVAATVMAAAVLTVGLTAGLHLWRAATPPTRNGEE